jgi:GWxTD domain-containing protein
MFAELPPESRPAFIEEFWLRRDPTPDTEENEFRENYYRRIEEANRLFRGTPRGWLQERGRYYILFGPPDERRTNPMGGRNIDATADPRDMTGGAIIATGEKGTEVWTYYNLFSALQKPQVVQLVFVDSDGTGNYRLATNLQQVMPGGIDSLLKPDMEFTHELYKEENVSARPARRLLFDFDWELLEQETADSNLTVQVSIPLRRVLFGAEGDRLSAELRLDLEVRDDKTGRVVWQTRHADRIEVDRREVEENPNAPWKASLPVAVRLPKGRYKVYLRLENSSGGQAVEKLLLLKM